MNLVGGKILAAEQCGEILEGLSAGILSALFKGAPDSETVIRACDTLVRDLDTAACAELLAGIGIDGALAKSYISELRRMFSAESLRFRLRTELGESLGAVTVRTPLFRDFAVEESTRPLGVILHIAAGNADGLPAFSVLEGLLTGNVNILKLPAADGGLSVRLLAELVRIEPALADFIYVFDYSSRDVEQLRKLIAVADAVSVWGGDAAVTALRGLVPPNVKLIEWGHKISFAYASGEITEEALCGLAEHIVGTGQLLCSSCQGVWLDTADTEEINAFCERFLPILEAAQAKSPRDFGESVRYRTALEVYNAELEAFYTDSRVFKGKQCSLIARKDSVPEVAIGFGNLWVKRLPRAEILSVLRPCKNMLQTVGLLCGDSKRAALADSFFRAGAVRVCKASRMSEVYCGQPHDGEFSLRRFVKIVHSDAD